jgi:molybdopterin biosynthesis enzyme MoaB
VIRALAITISNRASAGVYEDKSGPVLTDLLAEGVRCRDTRCPLTATRSSRPAGRAASGYQVIVTTAGPGLTAE